MLGNQKATNMNNDDLAALRQWRDEAEGDDKRLLRKALDHFHAQSAKLLEAKTLVRAALRVLSDDKRDAE